MDREHFFQDAQTSEISERGNCGKLSQTIKLAYFKDYLMLRRILLEASARTNMLPVALLDLLMLRCQVVLELMSISCPPPALSSTILVPTPKRET